METLDSLKFRIQIDEKPLEEFLELFHSSINKIVTVNQPQSGLQCFFKAHLEEQKQHYQTSLSIYQIGVQMFLDSLCAYRLAQIFSDQSNQFGVNVDKEKSYFFLIIAIQVKFQQLNQFQPLIMVERYIQVLDTNLKVTEEVLNDQSKKEQLVMFKETIRTNLLFYLGKQSYYDIIKSCMLLIKTSDTNLQSFGILRLIQLITCNLNTEDKCTDFILSVLNDNTLLPALQLVAQQININIQLMSCLKKDNGFFERTREHLFEIIFLIKNILKITTDNQKFNKIHDFIKISHTCGQLWTNIDNATNCLMDVIELVEKPIHKALLIRISSDQVGKGNPYSNKKPDYENGLIIQKTELEQQKPSKYNYALCNYHLAKLSKRLNLNEDYKTYLKTAQQQLKGRLLSQMHDDKFSKIITYYYLARIAYNMENYQEEYEYLRFSSRLLIVGSPLKQVRTIQYHTIKKKIETRLSKIGDDIKDQKELLENERTEQVNLLDQQRLMVLSMKLTQSNLSTPIKKSKVVTKQYQISGINNLSGPNSSIFTESINIHPQTAIQQYADQLNLDKCNSLDRKTIKFSECDGLYFVKANDIEERSILQKGSYEGGTYKISISGTKYGMKHIISLKKEMLEKILNIFKNLTNFSHPCLRKTLAYLLEPVSDCSYSLGIVYELTQHNLYKLKHLQITQDQKLQIAIDIVGAVYYLHQQKQYHGNLKPSNIMLNVLGGQVYAIVTDWEFCKNIYPLIYQDYLSIQGWSAPEVFQEEQKSTPLSDVWSVGMLLIFIFFNINISQHQNPYGQIDIPNENQTLCDVIQSMISKDPEQRQNLDDVLKILLAIK